jgi:hypothetical protein
MRAAADTKAGLRGWLLRLGAAVLTTVGAALALALFGSSSGPHDELVAGAFIVLLTLVVFPVAQYVWNYARAGERIAVDNGRDLERQLAASQTETEEALQQVRELEAEHAPLQGSTFQNLTLSLAAIGRDLSPSQTGPPVVAGRSFEDCIIEGPGVFTLVGTGSLAHSYFDDDLAARFIVVPDGTPLTGGVVMFNGCNFERCHFRRVGIIGTEALKELVLRGSLGSYPASRG